MNKQYKIKSAMIVGLVVAAVLSTVSYAGCGMCGSGAEKKQTVMSKSKCGVGCQTYKKECHSQLNLTDSEMISFKALKQKHAGIKANRKSVNQLKQRIQSSLEKKRLRGKGMKELREAFSAYDHEVSHLNTDVTAFLSELKSSLSSASFDRYLAVRAKEADCTSCQFF